MSKKKHSVDPTNPDHYKQHPGGIECIDVARFAGFLLGNAIKYIWRTEWSDHPPGLKIEFLKKAKVYINWQIEELMKEQEASHWKHSKQEDTDPFTPSPPM